MPRPYVSVSDRRLIIVRAQSRCEYCLSPAEYATQAFDIDHIVPLSYGGMTVIDNLALACSGCNSHKFNRTSAPDTIDGMDTPLFHPRQQRWQDHFVWSEDFSEVM